MVLIPVTSAFAVEIPDEQKRIVQWGDANGPATQGELFDDLDVWSFIPSQMQALGTEVNSDSIVTNIVCSTIEDEKCSKSLNINVRAYLPACIQTSSLYCIEEFWAIKNGTRINGVFKEQYPNEKTFGQFDAEPQYELPAGVAGGLWQLPGLTHDGGGDSYWINAQLLGSVTRQNISERFGKFMPNQIWSSVSAVNEVAAPGSVAPLAYKTGGSGTDTRPLTPSGAQCLVAGIGKCLLPWPLDEKVSYGMKVRMAHPIAGWLHGRINSPKFLATMSADGQFHLTMQGNPVKVPTVFAMAQWSELTDAMKSRFGGKPSGCCGSGDHWFETAGRNQKSEEMVKDLKAWLPFVKDTANATPTYWIVRTVAGGDDSNPKGCFAKGDINGVVTTNATAYTSGAPMFDLATQSLDYQVSSPHFDANGKVNIGNYNLQINSKVARCLYGFTSAPISATVSIISENGENQVATTTVKESNGWIYLTAGGFSYSSPTLKVKFNQSAAQVAPVKASPRKTTITCVKKSTVKKVSAINPKCPAGYKKK